MNGLAPLPGIPESALDGIPPAEDLPTVAHRRHYVQALACALAGEKGYELTTWARATMPVFMMLRAQQEDWPAVGTSSIVTLIQPAPLPDSPAELFMRALAQVPEPMRQAVSERLTCLWLGEQPSNPPPEVQTFIGDVLYRAGVAAAEEAFAAAVAVDPTLGAGGLGVDRGRLKVVSS